MDFCLVETVCFPDPPFYGIPVNGLLKIPCRNGNEYLVHWISPVRMGEKNHPKWTQMKRGTRFKEFPDPLFFTKPFFLFEGELPHEIKINPFRGPKGLLML